jgi:RimJ/RimL family protein N-acetyltransferase
MVINSHQTNASLAFDFSADHILENDRVLLRPLQEADYEHLLYYSENEPETWTYSLVDVAGKANLAYYIQKAIEGRDNKKEYPFIVFDKKEKKYAGCTRFYDIQLASQTLLLGYTWYGKAFRGSGLNKHCKFLLLDHAFNQMHIERVEFRADNNNTLSIAAMKSIGCTVEGLLRSLTRKPDGERRDSIVLSILKDEWNDSLREKLKAQLVHSV